MSCECDKGWMMHVIPREGPPKYGGEAHAAMIDYREAVEAWHWENWGKLGNHELLEDHSTPRAIPDRLKDAWREWKNRNSPLFTGVSRCPKCHGADHESCIQKLMIRGTEGPVDVHQVLSASRASASPGLANWREILSRPRVLLRGPSGAGKTLLASLAWNQAVRTEGGNAGLKWVKEPEFIRRAGNGAHTAGAAEWEAFSWSIRHAKLLVLDDFFKAQFTQSAHGPAVVGPRIAAEVVALFNDLYDDRHDGTRQVIVATNTAAGWLTRTGGPGWADVDRKIRETFTEVILEAAR